MSHFSSEWRIRRVGASWHFCDRNHEAHALSQTKDGFEDNLTLIALRALNNESWSPLLPTKKRTGFLHKWPRQRSIAREKISFLRNPRTKIKVLAPVSAKSADIKDGICQENQAISSACSLKVPLRLPPLGVSELPGAHRRQL